jgi:hypothetical protein
MTQDEQKAATVVALCEMYRSPLSDDGLRMYVAALSDLTAEEVAIACARLATTSKFRPSPAEVREAAGVKPISSEHRAALAFEAVMPAISRYGHWKSPDFDDPLINATIRHLGGWQRVCDLDVEEFEKWYRKDFIAAYAMLCDVGTRRDQTAPLLGGLEAENIAKGYTEPKYSNRVRVRTGLPWAGERVKRLGGTAEQPKRIETQKA